MKQSGKKCQVHFTPPEKVYQKLLSYLKNTPNQLEKELIIVPSTTMRERYYEFLLRDLPPSKHVGFSILTLNTFLNSILVEPPRIPTQVALIKLKKWLEKLPETHIFSAIAKRVSAPESILATLEEMEECEEITIPQNIQSEDQQIVKALFEAKEIVKECSINHRAKHYQEAAKLLLNQSEYLNHLFSQNIYFVGFYDLSKSQAVFFETLVRQFKKFAKEHSIVFLVPYSDTFYGDYSNRLTGWFSILAESKIEKTIEDNDSLINKRLLTMDGTGGKNEKGEQVCFAYQGIDEVGEIDALLRVAIKLAETKQIDFSDMAMILPYVEPYESIVRDYATYYQLPLRFVEGELLFRSKIGQQIVAFIQWLLDTEEFANLIHFLELLQFDVTSKYFTEQFRKFIIASSEPINVRLKNFADSIKNKSQSQILYLLAQILEVTDSVKAFGLAFLNIVQKISPQRTNENSDFDGVSYQQLQEICSNAIDWLNFFQEDEYPTINEWLVLVLNQITSERSANSENQQGLWVGRVHQLRGIPFRVVLIPGGGATFSGTHESHILPVPIKEQWNNSFKFPVFALPDDRESEMDWLFAMSVAMGEYVAISYPNVEGKSGKELSTTATFEDFYLSTIEKVETDITKIVPKRIELVKQVAFSESDKIYSVLTKHIPPSTICEFPNHFKIPKLQNSDQIGRVSQQGILETLFQMKCSPSFLFPFLQCPLKGFFEKFLPIRVIDRADVIDRDRGKIVHSIIAKIDADYQHLPPKEKWIDLINEALKELNYPPKEVDELEYNLLTQEVTNLLENWLQIRCKISVGTNIQTELNLESEITITIGNENRQLSLVGRIDAVEVIQNQSKICRVIDWKTGKKPNINEFETSREYVFQIPIYTYLVEKLIKNDLKFDHVSALIVYLKENTDNCIYEYTHSELEQLTENSFRRIANLVEEIARGYYPPVPQRFSTQNKSACDYCQFVNICLDRIKKVPQDLKNNCDYLNLESVKFGDRHQTIDEFSNRFSQRETNDDG